MTQIPIGSSPDPGGSPESVLAFASALHDRALFIGSLVDLTNPLTPGAGWTGAAAEAFAAQVRPLSPVLEAVAQRYAAGAEALARFADEFSLTRLDQLRARLIAEEARQQREGLELVLAQTTDPGSRLVLIHRIDDLQLRQCEANLRELAAHQDYLKADLCWSRRLDAICEDSLTDRGLYAFVSGVETWGSRVSMVSLGGRWFPPLEVAGWAADVLGTGAGVARWVMWGEGDATDLVVAGAFTVLGGFGSWARKGSGLLGSTDEASRTFAHGLRLGAQAHEREKWSQRLADLRTLAPAKAVNPALPAQAGGVLGPARARVEQTVDTMRAEWALAAPSGPAGRGLFWSGWGATGGAKAQEWGQQAKDIKEEAEQVTEERQPGLRPLAPTGVVP